MELLLNVVALNPGSLFMSVMTASTIIVSAIAVVTGKWLNKED
jgi:hypothetical protein